MNQASNHYPHSRQEFSRETEEGLREKLIRLSHAFARKGFRVGPYRMETWRDFRAFPAEKKWQIFRDFSQYYEIYMPVLSMPGSPNEDGRLLWAALKSKGLRPCSDFFSHVQDQDIVEFYGPSGLQIFHNINFFDVCSYTFLEIFSYPFTELWMRDEVTFSETKQVAIDGFSGKFKKTVDANLPQQYLIEAFSEDRNIIQLDFTKFSPLYDAAGAVAALAVVSRGQVIQRETYDQVRKLRPHLPAVERLRALPSPELF